MNGTQINLESVRPKVSGPMWTLLCPWHHGVFRFAAGLDAW